MPLDPQCAAIVEAAAQVGAPFAADDAQSVRAAYATTTARYTHAVEGALDVADRTVPAETGPIGVRVYRPQTVGTGPLGVLVFFHGGGWVVGNLDTHDHVCRYLAVHADCVVVAVDYRLAPEHKFPAAFDDCLQAVRWVAAHADELGADPARIAVGGDSAGGNLAASVALALRDQRGPALALQLLIYPAVDFTADTESLVENGDGYLLTSRDIEKFRDWYLPDAEAREDWRASPMLASHHTDLPRAWIQTAEFDPLRDEGRIYAETLAKSGVEVEYKCYDGMVHGFARMGGMVDGAFTALNDAARALRSALNA